MRFLMERAERLRMWKQGEGELGNTFSISLSEKWNGRTGQMLHGSLEAKARPQCSQLQPCFFHMLSVLWLQDITFLAPVSFLVQPPITQQRLSLPLLLFHHSSPFLNGNYDPPILLLRRPQQGLFTASRDSWFPAWHEVFHGVTSATCLLAPLSPFHVLHVSELMFPDRASHFFSLLLLLFT